MIPLQRKLEVRSWLSRRLSVEEAREYFLGLERDTLALIGSSGGWLQRFQDRIASVLQADDEIWLYDAPSKDWQALRGEKGVALVRNGQVIEIIIECGN